MLKYLTICTKRASRLLTFVLLGINLLCLAQKKDALNCPFDFRIKEFNYKNEFATVSSGNMEKTFPYQRFLDSASWWSINTISATFSELKSIQNNNHQQIEDVLHKCLADTLLSRNWVNDLDSMELLLDCSEKYLSYAEARPEYANFFGRVAESWSIHVSQRLGELAVADKSVKQSFKFQYLVQHSSCMMYPPNISQDKIEKLERELSEGNYTHILRRFWYGTSIVFKCIIILPLLLFLVVFFYGCICICQKHFKTKTKTK